MRRFSSQDIDSLRQCVKPGLVGASSESLERIVSESLSSLPAATSEDFLSTLGSLGKAVGPALVKAAPSALQGAAQGGSVGGPYGALIGGGLGLVQGLVQPQDKAKAAAAPVAPMQAPTTAQPKTAQAATTTAATSFAVTPAELPVGQSAAATVVGLFQNPVIMKALLSQVLGSNGSTTVQAPSGAELPRAAINQLLSQLLANAVEGLSESESITEQSYLMDHSGEYLVDPASPEQQAAMVLAHLRGGRASSESDGEERDARAGLWDEVDWISDEVSEDVDSLDESYREFEFY